MKKVSFTVNDTVILTLDASPISGPDNKVARVIGVPGDKVQAYNKEFVVEPNMVLIEFKKHMGHGGWDGSGGYKLMISNHSVIMFYN